jgi:hypothetical protein
MIEVLINEDDVQFMFEQTNGQFDILVQQIKRMSIPRLKDELTSWTNLKAIAMIEQQAYKNKTKTEPNIFWKRDAMERVVGHGNDVRKYAILIKIAQDVLDKKQRRKDEREKKREDELELERDF